MELVQLTPRPEVSDKLAIAIDPTDIWKPPSEEQLEAHERVKANGADPSESPLREIIFHLRSFDGDDQKAFSDKMLVGDKKGRQRMNAGEVGREKVLRGVSGIEGLAGENGTPIEKMTPLLYKRMPAWILTKVQVRLNERILDDEADEEE